MTEASLDPKVLNMCTASALYIFSRYEVQMVLSFPEHSQCEVVYFLRNSLPRLLDISQIRLVRYILLITVYTSHHSKWVKHRKSILESMLTGLCIKLVTPGSYLHSYFSCNSLQGSRMYM